MAIFLKLDHVDGLRLRHQTAFKVDRVDGIVKNGTEWRFEKDEVPRDLDLRTQKPLNTYSPTVNFGTKNLVIEKKGTGATLSFRNSSIRNQLRVKTQVFTEVRKGKDMKPVKEWQDAGTPVYIVPQGWGGAFVGTDQRAVLDEMPT